MRRNPQIADLLDLLQDFLAKKQEQLSLELGQKYGVPPDEVVGIVRSFLMDSYGPAMRLAEGLAAKSSPMLLFIGKNDCSICRRCKPMIEGFLSRHPELELVMLDYSESEGLLYHIIVKGEKGMLPLVAFLLRGEVRMVFTGECTSASLYEKCYHDILSEGSQNIYAN